MSEAGELDDRVLRTHEEARKNYDRLSGWYDFVSGGAEWKFDEAALLLLDPQPGEGVLEIGFGTGKALEWIRRRTGASGHVVGLDLSEGMRKMAAKRLAKAQFDDVELHVEDALALPFEERSFDGVFMGFTLELFDTPELPVVVGEVKRVLRESGRFVVAALSFRRIDRLPVRIYRWAHRVLPRTVDCRPIRLRSLIEEGGFSIIELREGLMWGLPIDLLLAKKPMEAD